MGLRAFFDERVTVRKGSTRYVVRKASVQTVWTATALYGHEMAGCWRAWKRTEDLQRPDPVEAMLPYFIDPPERSAAVLVTCVDAEDQAEVQEALAADRDLRRKIIHALCQVTDMGFVLDRISLDAMVEHVFSKKKGPELEDDTPSTLEIIVREVASMYGVTPMEVVTWPYEAVMTIAEQTTKKRAACNVAEQQAGDAFMETMGIPSKSQKAPIH